MRIYINQTSKQLNGDWACFDADKNMRVSRYANMCLKFVLLLFF